MPCKRLLRHFVSCLLRYMVNGIDMECADENRHAYMLADEQASVDLEDSCWVFGRGKEALERYLAWRLFGSQQCFVKNDRGRGLRWLPHRWRKSDMLVTPANEDWPETFDVDESV
jgi:hypothetical protein